MNDQEIKKLADENAKLKKEQDKESFTKELGELFASKWVERLIFWLLITSATVIVGIVVKGLITKF